MDVKYIVILGFLTGSQALYPYGELEGDTLMPKGDDLSEPYTLAGAFSFYGQPYSAGDTFWVSTNGIITLHGPENDFVPVEFPLDANIMIALFWDDMVPNHRRSKNKVFLRQTADSDLLHQITEDIRNGFCECADDFEATWALIVTYDEVKAYGTKRPFNTYQVVLVSDGAQTFAIFLYEDIEWTGVWTPGAQVGFNSGDGRHLTLPGALTPTVVDLETTSNVEVPGTWMYRVDRNFIASYPCGPNACVCEYGEDLEKDESAEMVRFDCSLKDFAWDGKSNADKTLVKSLDVTDPCRFKLVATTKKENGNVILARIKFEYGASPGGPGKFSRYVKIGGPDIKFWDGNVVDVDLTSGPFEESGPPHVKLTMMSGEVAFLESDDCHWRLEYRLEGNTFNEKVTFLAGTTGPFEGKCGICCTL